MVSINNIQEIFHTHSKEYLDQPIIDESIYMKITSDTSPPAGQHNPNPQDREIDSTVSN